MTSQVLVTPSIVDAETMAALSVPLLMKDKQHAILVVQSFVEELTKSNTNLTTKFAAFQEQVNKAGANVIKGFKDSLPFFNLLRAQYGEGFGDFCKHIILLYPDLVFFFVQIDTSILMTPHGGDRAIDLKDDADDTIEGEIVVPMTDDQAPLNNQAPTDGPPAADAPST
nr:hypothetical protein CFP56_37975 [Quercus suber]